MTIQNNALPTARKPLDLRRFLDDWVMLLAAIGIFVLCTLMIDNFLSPLNMRGLGLAISTTGIAACTMFSAQPKAQASSASRTGAPASSAASAKATGQVGAGPSRPRKRSR